MKASSGGNVRIGIVSFMTLVSIVLLAVLSVLCVVTANAAGATANRQATSSTELYEVDGMGQALLASIDEELAAGETAGETAEQAAARIQANVGEVAARAEQIAGAEGSKLADGAEDLTTSIEVNGTTVRFSITGPGGRTLDAEAQINDDLGYELRSWKMSTTQTASEESLWGGATTSK